MKDWIVLFNYTPHNPKLFEKVLGSSLLTYPPRRFWHQIHAIQAAIALKSALLGVPVTECNSGDRLKLEMRSHYGSNNIDFKIWLSVPYNATQFALLPFKAMQTYRIWLSQGTGAPTQPSSNTRWTMPLKPSSAFYPGTGTNHSLIGCSLRQVAQAWG